MKQLFVIAALVALASCGGNSTTETTTTTDSTTVNCDSTKCVDSTKCDSIKVDTTK
jgi:hypothetical protein